ncbi:MAG: hypothetical protein WDO14_14835 [Bacteroidota bacterium]
MRRILYYSLLCLLWVSVNSCKDDEASQPPTPTFTVDRTSGLYNSTEFVFTIDQVGSNAVSLLPYGEDHPNDAGVLVPSSSFTNGKATVKFVYSKVGTFNAVVVANNHTGDGLSVKNTLSAPQAITITSNRNAITDFSFDKSTKTVIDTTAHTITVTVPFGTDLTGLKAKFTTSDFATVTVGGTAQTSGTSANNFSSPVTYAVKAQNGTTSQDWTVTVNTTPVETDHSFKSASGIIANTGDAAGRALPSSLDNTGHIIVVYDTAGVDPDDYDSVAFTFARNNSFGYVKLGTHKLSDKDTLDLSSDQTVTAVAQDSSRVDYTLAFRAAPELTVSFPALNPLVEGSNDGSFAVNLNVLTGTTVAALKPTLDFGGATIGQIKIDKGSDPAINYNAGDTVNFTKPVTFIVPVTDGGVTYNVRYTVTLTVK